MSRSGAWTLLSAATVTNGAATLLSSVRDRIASTQTPALSRAPNSWVELWADLRRLNNAFKFGWSFPNLPQVTLALTGDGATVRTTGEVVFPGAIPARLDPWKIPTNVICDPLVSFTAVRGVATWLGSWSGWSEPKLGPAPNQVFFWAQSPALWQHFMTYPIQDGIHHVASVTEYVLQKLNPIFEGYRTGKFEWEMNNQRLLWMGVPYFKPQLYLAQFQGTDFPVYGLFANNATNRPVPPGLFTEFNTKPNLVYYDWEITGPQVTSWTQMGQLTRMVFGRVQLRPGTASLPWLRAITPLLGNVTTVMTLESPERIALKRSSTCGLTSVELHLLADWLESPDFPVGIHTLVAKRVLRPLNSSTNAPPR